MEQIDAYYDIREAPFGEGDKAAVRVTAEEADAAALLRRVIPEIGGQVFKIHAWKDVDNAADGTIGDISVETVAIPAHGILIINFGRVLKLSMQRVWGKREGFGKSEGKQEVEEHAAKDF